MIPPEQNAEFVARMEDVLEVYHRPYDPKRPVVCLDEQPTQLVGETRQPIPVQPGQPARYDYEYERLGSATNFMITEPLAGWRKVNVRETKTAIDLAQESKDRPPDLVSGSGLPVKGAPRVITTDCGGRGLR